MNIGKLVKRIGIGICNVALVLICIVLGLVTALLFALTGIAIVLFMAIYLPSQILYLVLPISYPVALGIWIGICAVNFGFGLRSEITSERRLTKLRKARYDLTKAGN